MIIDKIISNMAFNINTATNSELKEEAKKFSDRYTLLQQEIKERFKEMMELSEMYVKITSLLNKREGKANDTNKG